ncbi:SRPBCC family protein [Gluconacetobacter aggeris]|uniref:SRPBCC family protein n=1 Tax=Gluconacetobacter aggeris TaxID=1286186 RepID=A0A7W4IVE6_9PROT|nr:SRPBCC family protein [Gluconacetobacter aggeris]MBB2169717.1 SRPBCC family protein [Gluconacetobacter aggeris]
MAGITRSIEIDRPAGTVWDLIGNFDSLPLWLDQIATSVLEEDGRVRRLTTTSGAVIIERLLHFDDAAQSVTYAHVEAPDPVRDYVATMTVNALGPDRARATWHSTFIPVGISEEQAIALFATIYEGGLSALKTRLEAA